MTKIYGIVGHPIENSLSPAIYQAAFESAGIDAQYKLFDINPNDPEELANLCYESDMKALEGFSVTMPFKQIIMDYIDYYDPLSKKLGSVNTVKNENSNLNGYNTDITGAMQALREKTKLPGKKTLVMGAGGTARAIVYGLNEFGAEVFIFNRTIRKAEVLAKEFDAEYIDFLDIANEKFDIIINATPVGSFPHIEQSLLSSSQIKEGAIVMDIITNPIETQLLKEAKTAGADTISGERMLLHQAVGQFEIWFDKSAPFEAMESALYERLATK